MNYLMALVIGYAFGCIQTGYLIGKVILKKDIRTLGNGNAGASNATLVFGRRFGAFTAFIDILKGFASVMLLRWVLVGSLEGIQLYELLYLNGLFVILGHNFPFYMQFKGGKGTASLVGVMYGLSPWLGLVGMMTMLLVSLASDYIVVGTMGLLLALILHTILFHWSPLILLIDLVIVLMSVYKHWPNFSKIKKGTEKHVRTAVFKKNNE